MQLLIITINYYNALNYILKYKVKNSEELSNKGCHNGVMNKTEWITFIHEVFILNTKSNMYFIKEESNDMFGINSCFWSKYLLAMSCGYFGH